MYWLRSTIIVIVAALLWGCDGDDAPKVESTNRMILIYMAANNNLGSAGYDQSDIDEMVIAAKQGWGDNRVLLFHATDQRTQTLQEITATGISTLKTYDPAISSLAPERISQVIADSRRLSPAKDYGLVLWSHADGWIAPLDGSNASQRRSFGSDNGKQLDIPTLARTLEPWGFSFICFDCCYMANVESLYEMRRCTRWVTASAIELPAPGMRYDINLPLLLAPEPDLVGSAQATFNYYDSLSGSYRTCAMSVVDLQAMPQLAAATRAIYAAAHEPDASYTPQRFMPAGLRSCYLYDFADYIEAHGGIDPQLMSNWRSALESAVVYAAATPSIWSTVAINAHCGLSTYILQSATDATTRGYDNLQWWTDVASTKYLDN